jgi:hypothetical protein
MCEDKIVKAIEHQPEIFFTEAIKKRRFHTLQR